MGRKRTSKNRTGPPAKGSSYDLSLPPDPCGGRSQRQGELGPACREGRGGSQSSQWPALWRGESWKLKARQGLTHTHKRIYPMEFSRISSTGVVVESVVEFNASASGVHWLNVFLSFSLIPPKKNFICNCFDNAHLRLLAMS